MPLLIVVGIIVVAIIISNQNKQKMYQSEIYSEWFQYYIKSGYTPEQAESYAISQYKRGDRLSNYGVSLNSVTAENPGEATLSNTASTPSAKAKDPYATINWVLAIACFCVIVGLLAMIGELNDALIAPLFIVITLALFAAGVAIRICVKFLKPVGTAFTISSLVLLPFCAISFEEILGNGSAAWTITTLLSLVAYATAAYVFRFNALGTLSYVWSILFLWSITLQFPVEYFPYFFFLPPLVVGYIASYFYISKTKWLPVCFRSGSLACHKVIPILSLCSLAFLMLFPGFAKEFPLFRTIFAILIAGIYFWDWSAKKTASKSVGLRYVLQTVILVLVADILNYSFISISYNYNERANMVFSIIWAISFFAQATISLFAKQKSAEAKASENKSGIIALVGVGATLMIAGGLEESSYGVVACTVLAIVATLGVMYAKVKKNIDWLFASLGALVILPIVLSEVVFGSAWTEICTFVYFTVLSLLTAILHLWTAQQDSKKAMRLSLWSIAISGSAVLISGLDFPFFSLAVLVPTISLWMIALIDRKQKSMQEIAIYLTGYTLVALVQDIMHTVGNCSGYLSTCANNIADIQKFIQLNIVGITLFFTSYLYEKNKDGKAIKQTRLVWGYTLFSFLGSLVALFAHSDQNNMTIGIIFLLEQAILLAVGAFMQRRWLAISSGCIIVIGGLYMTDLYRYTYIWLIMLGIALIGLVVWWLVAMNNKTKQQEVGPATESTPQTIAEKAPEVIEEKAEILEMEVIEEDAAEEVVEEIPEKSEETPEESEEDSIKIIESDLEDK